MKSYRGVGLAAVLAVAGLVWTVEAQQPPASMPNFGGAGQLITYLIPSADAKPTALTIVEPATKRIVVYHMMHPTRVFAREIFRVTFDT